MARARRIARLRDGTRRRSFSARALGTVLCVALLALASACASSGTTQASSTGATAEEPGTSAGLGVGAVFASLLYSPAKIVYAVGGSVAAGLAWIFSGANDDAALAVLIPATTGDWVITPDKLRDPGTIQFVGRRPGLDEGAVAASPQTVDPETPGSLPATSDARPAVSAPPPAGSTQTAAGSADACDSPSDTAPSAIHFALNDARVPPDAQGELDHVATLLALCPDRTLRIQGFADDTGPSSYNLRLSDRRAHAVADYLVGQGVERSRITTEGLGDTQPIGSNETEAGRAMNRRAELRLEVR